MCDKSGKRPSCLHERPFAKRNREETGIFMKKGEIYEGIVEKTEFPNRGIIKAEDRRVTVKNAGRVRKKMDCPLRKNKSSKG